MSVARSAMCGPQLSLMTWLPLTFFFGRLFICCSRKTWNWTWRGRGRVAECCNYTRNQMARNPSDSFVKSCFYCPTGWLADMLLRPGCAKWTAKTVDAGKLKNGKASTLVFLFSPRIFFMLFHLFSTVSARWIVWKSRCLIFVYAPPR